MADNKIAANDAVEHIGAEAHGKRNTWMVVGGVVAAALVGLFYWQGGKSDDAAVLALHSFRATMATECKQDQFARPMTAGLDAIYADSRRMQAVVTEQLGILKRGQPNCDQIVKALKSVDYPVE